MPPSTPSYPLLGSIESPADLRALDERELPALAAELREFLIQTVSTRGGHFAAGLGTVELTIALHYVYNTPEDRLVWDVGHQAYPHKVLTGRRDRLHSIKQRDGLAPFPTRSESPYDAFGVGHSSTSVSAALGMAIAAELHGEQRRAVAVIGDGAMSAGHGLRGAQPRRQPADQPAGGTERQRHVDLGERRRAVELSGARDLGAAVRAAARRRQESAAADADHARARPPLRGTRQGHGAAGHAVRGDGIQLRRADRWSRSEGAAARAAQRCASCPGRSCCTW